MSQMFCRNQRTGWRAAFQVLRIGETSHLDEELAGVISHQACTLLVGTSIEIIFASVSIERKAKSVAVGRSLQYRCPSERRFHEIDTYSLPLTACQRTRYAR